MNWIPAAIAAVATLVGVVIGGWLNHYFAIRAVTPMAQIRETTDAYVDFINGVATLAQSQRVDADSHAHYSQLAAAKARIAIYGHPSVIAALADFIKQGAQITPDTFDAFSLVVHAMREHVGKDESRLHSTENDIKILLFGIHDRDG